MDLNSLSSSFKEKLSSIVVTNGTNGVKSHSDETYVLKKCKCLRKLGAKNAILFDLWILRQTIQKNFLI